MEIIDVNVQWGFYPRSPIDASPQRVSLLLQEAGIAKGLAISLKSSLLSYGEGNRETLLISRHHPLLLPLLTVDPRDYPRCMEELETAKDRGFVALRLFRHLGGRGAVLKEILHLCVGLTLPILTDFVPPYEGINELPPLVLLDIPLEELGEALLLLERAPVYLEFTSPLLASGRMNEKLKSKLVFGSRLPSLFPSLRLRLIEELFPSPRERELILGANAKRLFSPS